MTMTNGGAFVGAPRTERIEALALMVAMLDMRHENYDKQAEALWNTLKDIVNNAD